MGIALGLLGGASLRQRWEDSGLMLFSKFPFKGIRIPDALAQLAGMSTGITIPNVAYVPYEDAVGGDKNAAKGVVYAQLELPDESLFNIMISHTQADPLDDIGKNKATRKSQFTAAMALLTAALGATPPARRSCSAATSTLKACPTPTGCGRSGRPCWARRRPC